MYARIHGDHFKAQEELGGPILPVVCFAATCKTPLVHHFLINDAVWCRHCSLVTNMKVPMHSYHIVLQKE